MIDNSVPCRQAVATPTCKITVLGKVPQDRAHESHRPGRILCPCFTEGQEFTVSTHPGEGFCDLAWSDIHTAYVTLMREGTCPEEKDRNMIIARCRDRIRPVFFKLERIDDRPPQPAEE
jgi:uncharacterized repeat protein (TIGR04076 family)